MENNSGSIVQSFLVWRLRASSAHSGTAARLFRKRQEVSSTIATIVLARLRGFCGRFAAPLCVLPTRHRPLNYLFNNSRPTNVLPAMLDITIFNAAQHTQTRHVGQVAVACDPSGRWHIDSLTAAAWGSNRLECVPFEGGYTVRNLGTQATGEPGASCTKLPLGGVLQMLVGSTHIELRAVAPMPASTRRLEPLSAGLPRRSRHPTRWTCTGDARAVA